MLITQGNCIDELPSSGVKKTGDFFPAGVAIRNKNFAAKILAKKPGNLEKQKLGKRQLAEIGQKTGKSREKKTGKIIGSNFCQLPQWHPASQILTSILLFFGNYEITSQVYIIYLYTRSLECLSMKRFDQLFCRSFHPPFSPTEIKSVGFGVEIEVQIKIRKSKRPYAGRLRFPPRA